MEIELHELELRYAAIRVRDPARAARMRASLAANGQQSPVCVIATGASDASRFVLIDGYLRVSAARALALDLVTAVLLPLSESDAQRNFTTLTELMTEEQDARPVHTHGDPTLVQGGPRSADDRAGAAPVA
jgi:hypothetical protein